MEPPDFNSMPYQDCLPIPPLDNDFFTATSADLDISFTGDYDFDFTFDDIDDLHLSSESDPHYIPQGESDNPADRGSNDVDKYLKCRSPDSGSYNRDQETSGTVPSPVLSGNCDCGVPETSSPVLSRNCGSHVSETSSPVLSGNCGVGVSETSSPVSVLSGNCGSGVSETSSRVLAANGGSRVSEISSPVLSANCGSLNVSSSSSDSENRVVDRKVKVVETGKSSVSKRKKESEDTNGESRSIKCRKPSETSENGLVDDEDDEKRKARLMRNRESAQLSRQRKKHYVEELEEKVRNMSATIADLNSKLSYCMAECATLRQQVQMSGGSHPHPHPHPQPLVGMYPPIGYPWLPAYMVKAQGSQVPLVPIPRLIPKQSAPKAKPKKDTKTKKVASISLMGLFFFIFLFSGLVPFFNVNYGREAGSSFASDRYLDQHQQRGVLAVNNSQFSNSSFDATNRKSGCEQLPGSGCGSEEGAPGVNASAPLVASLYVPRNDKLVKIDGNLIIHSVMASEKARASKEVPPPENNRETGLAIPRGFSPMPGSRSLHSHIYRTTHEQQQPQQPKALSSGTTHTLKDHFKSSAADGKLQQWFREGVAGPMLSSGMCTEVFQFDVSPPQPGAGGIIPVSSVANITEEHSRKANKGKNRRILHNLPAVPLPGSEFNLTGDENRKEGNKSMIVSVLVDPREVADIDGMMSRPKSLSNIFVVVLMDSVKYVTYSCVLPRSGLHLVN